jgi:hypothetical protein
MEVNARTESEAMGKAFSWTGDFPQGQCLVGDYYCADDDFQVCHHDHREAFWEIVDIEPISTSRVTELLEDDEEVEHEDERSIATDWSKEGF